MSAGLPLLAISVIACVVMIAWQFGGVGSRVRRLIVASLTLGGLGVSWLVLLGVGVFHPAGAAAMGTGFVLAFVSLFVPWLWRLLPQSISGARGAVQQGVQRDGFAAR
jgi:hypothetical protein